MTVREGWVVFGPDGNPKTAPRDTEDFAWECFVSMVGVGGSVERYKDWGCTCEYVEMTFCKKDPPANGTSSECIQALRDAGLSAWDDVPINKVNEMLGRE